MEEIELNPDSPRSEDNDFINDEVMTQENPLFLPQPFQGQPIIPIIREIAALSPPRFEAQTPEPMEVTITSGKNKGKTRKKASWPGIRAEKILFTYSALDEKYSPEKIAEAMGSWRYKLRQWSGCYERHKAPRDDDGNIVGEGKWHIHILGRRIYHPNFSAAKQIADVWCYIKKVGNHEFHSLPEEGEKEMAGDCKQGCTEVGNKKQDVHCNGDPQNHEDFPEIKGIPQIADPRKNKLQSDDSHSRYETVCSVTSNRAEFDRVAGQLIARDMLLHRQSIELHKDLTFGKSKANDLVQYTDTNQRYRTCSVIDKYFERFVINRPDDRQRCPSLCIVSMTGAGKTDYIRRMGAEKCLLHTYHAGMITGKKMNTRAAFNVFDNVEWEEFAGCGGYKAWVGCHKQVNIRDLWFKGTMVWGRPSVFLVNKEADPFVVCEQQNSPLDREFIEHNMVVIYLKDDEPLYYRNDQLPEKVVIDRIMYKKEMSCSIDLDFLIE